ncbi:MAG: thioesterase domain-containing protein, partial [Paracoccaceae bacterium]
EEMAAENIRYMRQHQPKGPYLLAGYSGGAITAFEMARQIEENGEKVARLIILDTFAPGFAEDFVPNVQISAGQRLKHELWQLRSEGLSLSWNRGLAKLRAKLARGSFKGLVKAFSLSHYRYEMMRQAWRQAAMGYQGAPIDIPITLLKTPPVSPVETFAFEQDPSLGWKSVVPPEKVEIVMTAGDHRSMLNDPHVAALSNAIAIELTRN